MKAVEAKLLAFLKKSPQFVIPIYQRSYSWTERECRQLWNDILKAGRSNKISGHFVGSIVYVEQGLYSVTTQSPLLVIDGQQRLTTVSLLILALAEALGTAEPIEGFSARRLRHYYLVNAEEEGERYFKLLLSQTDTATLTALVGGTPLPQEHSIRVKENLDLFRSWITEASDELSAICEGLAKLMVVDISLDRDQDNPQLIFESMNSTGLELSQADLIRNFILMSLDWAPQKRLYEHYWRPMEREFGQRAYSEEFDGFMRHYLTVKTGVIPKEEHVYREFKQYSQSFETGDEGVEALVKDIRTHASYFCRMALHTEPDPGLRAAFKDLRELKVEVAFPLLLELYADYDQGLLSKEGFLEVLRLIESYVFRRAVCEIPTNSLNKTFATFTKGLKKDRYLDSLRAQFMTLPSYRRFPKNDEFKRQLQERDMYHFRSRSYWLRRLENHGRKEPISVEEYTIEHIMPQNENVPAAWQQELGEDWQRIHGTYLHKLGNLTLTGYNSEYSDKPFAEKRDMEGGFRESPLRVNRGIGLLETWNEAAILQRATQLADQCCNVWTAPVLDESTIAMLTRKVASTSTPYSIDDHPHVATGAMKGLFQMLRQAILSLDACVNEEFLKLYIAYKAETNFVDIIPQAGRLLLSINIPYPELDDPRGLTRDVTGLGRWGNGDVELGVATEGDIPYAIGLIRQAFERQLEFVGGAGNGELEDPTGRNPSGSAQKAEYRAFFEALQARFLELCPQAKSGTVSGKHYHQIPVGISGVHYEWGFHGRPRQSLGIELHFESKEASQNHPRLDHFQQRFAEWQKGLPPNVQIEFVRNWGQNWSRLYFSRPAMNPSPDLVEQAAEDMAALYRSTIDLLLESSGR
ncbi:GmrSD restriction endonuclease domain-containing protein [Geothrix paludis]|uniref:GmrSD restriction endonuclease domain-containing protein n=1 Tax=Geothrix paludis TaxID=2922722 RepID=UPI001FAD53B4|nr:DUF262 domain-containing protein [Geothrix paludis]